MALNSFAGTRLTIGNSGVRSVISEVMQFRTQITRKDELRSVGGWSDALNNMLAEYLGSIRTTLALVTDDPRVPSGGPASSVSSSPDQAARQAEREAAAADESATLRGLFGDSRAVSTDDVQMPASATVALPYDFSGANSDIPQMSDPKFKNAFLIQFVTVLDMTVRDLSNLASATYGNVIPRDQSAMIHSRLEEAFAILEHKGVRRNAPKIADGTDPESLTGKVGTDVAPVVITDPAPEIVGGEIKG